MKDTLLATFLRARLAQSLPNDDPVLSPFFLPRPRTSTKVVDPKIGGHGETL